MVIRKAKSGDIDGILKLLSQVLEIHAEIRPDIFRHGTTKYTKDELAKMLGDENRPIYVAADDSGTVLGYAFCAVKEPMFTTTMYAKKTFYIDDLCVDANVRGGGIGKSLFEYVKSAARHFGCDDITLAVWEGNDSARAFYERMGMSPRETIMEIKAD